MFHPKDEAPVGLSGRPVARRPSAVSQALCAIREEVERGTEGWDSPESAGYRFLVAHSALFRARAIALAHRVYAASGYVSANAAPEAAAWDARPETFTLLAQDAAGRDAATISLVFDGPAGLPCDELFAGELAPLRTQGRQLVEVTRLAIDKAHTSSKLLLVRLFNFIYVHARRMRGYDDFVIEVNPRHVTYYIRLLMFQALGPERPCPRVNGAPARLLLLPLETPEAAVRRVGGNGAALSDRTLYPHFYPHTEEDAVAELLAHRC